VPVQNVRYVILCKFVHSGVFTQNSKIRSGDEFCRMTKIVSSDQILKFCVNRPGVDVMITIFCDFCQFSAKKMAFFSKANVIIKTLHNLALF
jgi:hypothetical protein